MSGDILLLSIAIITLVTNMLQSIMHKIIMGETTLVISQWQQSYCNLKCLIFVFDQINYVRETTMELVTTIYDPFILGFIFLFNVDYAGKQISLKEDTAITLVTPILQLFMFSLFLYNKIIITVITIILISFMFELLMGCYTTLCSESIITSVTDMPALWLIILSC